PIVRSTPAMSEHLSSPRISRRSLLGGAAAAAVAAGLPRPAYAARRPPAAGIADGHVRPDHYGVPLEPSVPANSRPPPPLLAAFQASPTANPPFHRDLPVRRRGRDLAQRRPAAAAPGPSPAQ